MRGLALLLNQARATALSFDFKVDSAAQVVVLFILSLVLDKVDLDSTRLLAPVVLLHRILFLLLRQLAFSLMMQLLA